MDITLKAEQRSMNVKANRLRMQGQIPCTIYSKSIKDISIQIPAIMMQNCLKAGAKKVSVMIGKKNYMATIEEVQKKVVTNEIIHVSFHAFEANEKIHLTIPVHLVGKANGSLVGGVLQQQLNEITVYGLAKDLPEVFDVDVTNLELGHSFHLADFAKGKKFHIEDALDKVIVACNFPKLEPVNEPIVDKTPEEIMAEAATLEAASNASEETSEKVAAKVPHKEHKKAA